MPRTLLLTLLLSSSLCAQNAYCVDTNLDILYSLDLSTGNVTAIGSTLNGGNLQTPADLCWRDSTSEIWTIDLASGRAGTIDPTTAVFTTVWNTGVTGWQAMAWDHTTSQFFCHNQNGQLSRLDPTTGVLTLVGTIPGALITGMDVDATGRLWALNFSGSLVELDKNTGLALGAPITTTVINFQSLSIDPSGVWYGISTLTDSLYTINPTNGVCTLIGANPGTQFVKGMVIAASPGPGYATNTTLGVGCINVPDVSSYENFATSAAFDLSNSAITLLNIGTGYLALPGVTTYVPPSGTAQVIAVGDDVEQTVALSQPMPVGASGTTSSLTVCSNGFISSGTGNGTGFTPTPSTFLNGPQAWWSLCWHDYNPSIAGSGQIKFEQIGTIAYVTWDGVWDFGGGSAANANTMQAQFDVTTGTVHFVYGTMSTLGNGRLVGFSSAGASADPGSMDISAALPATYTAAVFAVTPLGLTATTRPVLNTSWNLTTGSIPATGVFGVDIFGVADPGILDLFFLGMPGCQLRSSLDVIVGPWLVGGATHNYSLPVPAAPPSLIGLDVFTQSALFQAPPVNPFGAITSNGIKGTLGNL